MCIRDSQSDFSNTSLGRGIQEGKTNLVSTGWTRGHKPTLVAGGEPKGAAGAGSSAPLRAAPTAASGSNVRAISSGATVTALKPVVTELSEGATAFKRDYEERAKELAEEIAEENHPDLFEEETEASPTTALFSDKAQADASAAKALAAERRAKAVMQGYTGNMCSECQNFTMVRNGTCEKCDTCGATSGCS